MLIHPTLELLQRLRLTGMYKALHEQLQMPDIESLRFEERLGLLLERELTERETRHLRTRLRQAKLRENAAIEDLDYRTHRGLDKALMTRLAACQWIGVHLNVLITGPTGVGKTWIACALAQKACREGFSARYLRLPRLLQQLGIARADGSYPKLLAELAKTDLLVLDDWVAHRAVVGFEFSTPQQPEMRTGWKKMTMFQPAITTSPFQSRNEIALGVQKRRSVLLIGRIFQRPS